MSTELIEVPVAGDVVNDLHLIARTPGEMRSAQSALVQWCAAKVAILEKDAAELFENWEIAMRHKWKSDTLKRHHEIAEKRVDYYRKIQAAVQAGYCIVPNFPVDIFAIRTKRKTPDKMESTSQSKSRDQRSDLSHLGAGEWKDSSPQIYQRDLPTGEIDKQTGKDIMRTNYHAKYFQDEIEFPISVAKPEIMTATAEAMAMKCFDEIGVLPNRRIRNVDPIVVGRVYDPRDSRYRSRFVTFMIAWYVDTADI